MDEKTNIVHPKIPPEITSGTRIYLNPDKPSNGNGINCNIFLPMYVNIPRIDNIIIVSIKCLLVVIFSSAPSDLS